MSQDRHSFARLLAVITLAAGMAPAKANAWPLGRLLHLHPQLEDPRITFHLVNNDSFVQQVKVDGRIYTMPPHVALTIKATEGTEVYAVTAGIKHRPGELLVAVKPQTRDKTVTFE